jgi:outer membrane receptor protein involved in Fe transport
LTLNDVQNYTQPINFGISTYDLSQWLVSGFLQDSFRVMPDLTLDLGLRYDVQTLTTIGTIWSRALALAGVHTAARTRRFVAAMAFTMRRFAPTRSRVF